MFRALRHRASSHAVRMGIALGRLPIQIGARMGGTLGRLAYYLFQRERGRAIDHLATAFPDRSDNRIRLMARLCFEHLGIAAMEFLRMSRAGRSWVNERLTVLGEHHLKRAVERGRGVLYLTGHVGNWEMMAAWVAQRYPLWVVGRENAHEAVTKAFSGIREQFGVRQILWRRERQALRLRDVLRALNSGDVVGMLIDQDVRGPGEMVPFFGKPANTPTIPAQLALRTGATVIFGFTRRVGAFDRGRHELHLQRPYVADPTRSPADSAAAGLQLESDPSPGKAATDVVRAYTAHFTTTIENAIRYDPIQWVWMHRRWLRDAEDSEIP